jgi:hypothetical protein
VFGIPSQRLESSNNHGTERIAVKRDGALSDNLYFKNIAKILNNKDS